ncbi:hypothetical protein R6Q57_024026 [Mikania cordata]
MNPPSYHRSLLQEDAGDRTFRSPAAASFTTTSPLDSSLVLTILILLTVLFFMVFFSLYIRRFSNTSSSVESDAGRRAIPSRLLIKRNGAESSTVESLPNVQFGRDSNILIECSICLSEFEERETLKVIPYCGHGFHPVCIETWLASHISCPLCRSTQLFPAVDEVRTGTGKMSDGCEST